MDLQRIKKKNSNVSHHTEITVLMYILGCLGYHIIDTALGHG